MMKINRWLHTIVAAALSLSVLLWVAPAAFAAGPTLLLQPTTETLSNGASKTFTVNVNTAGLSIFGADAIITFNPNAFEVTSVSNGTFFTDSNSSKDNAAGKLELHGYFGTLADYRAGTGTLGTFILKAKKDSGTGAIALLCNTSANTSQIIDRDGQNILPCTGVNESTITLTGSANTTPTPSPTGTHEDAAPSCNGLSVSPTSGNKPLTVNAVCAGSDSDNDVTAAEFDFGDGNKKLVEKGIGQFGSISTTYTYTSSGTFGISCRVRDNIQKFSSVPDICKSAIIVSSIAVISPTLKPTIPYATSAPANNTNPVVYTGGTEVITLNPYATPTPTIHIVPTQILLPKPINNDKLYQLGTILFVSIITIAAGLILRRMMSDSN